MFHKIQFMYTLLCGAFPDSRLLLLSPPTPVGNRLPWYSLFTPRISSPILKNLYVYVCMSKSAVVDDQLIEGRGTRPGPECPVRSYYVPIHSQLLQKVRNSSKKQKKKTKIIHNVQGQKYFLSNRGNFNFVFDI